MLSPRTAFEVYRSMPSESRARIVERIGSLSTEGAAPLFIKAVEEELAAIEAASHMTKH